VREQPTELPEPFSSRRVGLLKAHADEVLDIRTRARGVWLEMLGREVQLLVMDGFSPALAQIAAKNNLALRRQELDSEVEENLVRLRDELTRKLQRVVEDWEDEQT
jgi:hypothetical protein